MPAIKILWLHVSLDWGNDACYDTLSYWPQAPTGYYNFQSYGYELNGADYFPPDGGTAPLTVYCDMNSQARAAISGCNGGNFQDCEDGYEGTYNWSCSEIWHWWPTAPSGNYYTTPIGTPFGSGNDIVLSTCQAPSSTCLALGPGNVCSDGTVYAGAICSNGTPYNALTNPCSGATNLYFPPVDQGFAAYSIDTNLLGASDPSNGQNNYSKLMADNSPAETLCSNMRTSNAYGHNDWYLPTKNELIVLLGNNSNVFGLLTNPIIAWWTSTEYSGTLAYYNYGGIYNKWNVTNVRCMRRGP